MPVALAWRSHGVRPFRLVFANGLNGLNGLTRLEAWVRLLHSHLVRLLIVTRFGKKLPENRGKRPFRPFRLVSRDTSQLPTAYS